MNTNSQIAKHIRDVHFGGNWTASNLKDILTTITWQQATTKIESFNTIATLVFHINYYISAALKVLEGKPLDAKDEFSFSHPPIQSAKDWELLLENVWLDAKNFANLIEQLPNTILHDYFTDEKYGTYFRNFHGIIEHTHYHLGQIVILKKMIQNS